MGTVSVSMRPVAATQTGILHNIVAVADIVHGLAIISPFAIPPSTGFRIGLGRHRPRRDVKMDCICTRTMATPSLIDRDLDHPLKGVDSSDESIGAFLVYSRVIETVRFWVPRPIKRMEVSDHVERNSVFPHSDQYLQPIWLN